MKLDHLVGRGARGLLGLLVTILACSSHGDGASSLGTTAEALACISDQEAAAAQPWTLGKQYKLNEQVRFSGRTYACMQPVCVAQQGWEPGADGLWAIWQAVPLCGIHPWETLTAYDTGQIVSYGGALYRALQPSNPSLSTSSPQSAPALWEPYNPAASCPTSPGQAAGPGTPDPDPDTILKDTLVDTEPTAPGGTETVGTLPGSFDVTGDGASAYRIDLWTPPGRMGIEPRLALSFNSRSERGLLGIGWDLTGFGISRITRCHTTVAQDGDATPIRFDDDDAFCLDSARLVPVPGGNVGAIRDYRLERDPFTRVTFDTAAKTFRVQMRDGRVLDYGSSSGSRHSGARDDSVAVIYAWAIDRVRDPLGNTMTVSYRQYDGATSRACSELLPIEIAYTSGPSAGQVARRRVAFTYTGDSVSGGPPMPPASPPTCRYVAGFGVAATRLLEQIDVYGPGDTASSVLRSYVMSYKYRSSVTSRPLLQSVKECDGKGICEPASTFDWDEGDDGSPANRARFQETVTPVLKSGGILTADINGDGKDDILFPRGGPSSAYLLSDGKGFNLPASADGTPEPHVLDNITLTPKTTPIDINMDGRVSLAHHEKDPSSVGGVNDNTHTVHFRSFVPSTGDFALTPVDMDVDSDISRVYVGDMNGDGRPEVAKPIRQFGGPPGWTRWGYLANRPGRFGPFTYLGVNTTEEWYSYMAQLDGTGKSSLLLREAVETENGVQQGDHYLALSLGQGTDGTAQVIRRETSLPIGNLLFVDANGDGNEDALHIPAAGGIPSLGVNTGEKFDVLRYMSEIPAGFEFRARALFADNGARIGDWNGDGLPDILFVDATDGTLDKNGVPARRLAAYTSDGAFGFKPEFLLDQNGVPLSAGLFGDPLFLFDIDGDGLQEMALAVEHDDPDGVRFYLHMFRRIGGKPDQMTGIHDGLGKAIGIKYRPITDESVYTRGTSCSYPQYCANRGMWVVAEHSISADWDTSGKPATGTDPVNRFNYTYADGRSDLRGRGWLGVRRRTMTDEQTGITTTTTYSNDGTDTGFGYPLAGLPSQSVTVANLSDRQRIYTTNTDYEVQSHLNGHAAIVRPKQVHELVEERFGTPGGPSSVQLVNAVTTFGYDAFNNPTSHETTWSSGEKHTSTASYDQNQASGKWLLSLLRRTDETSTVPGQPPVKRSHSYTPNPNTGLLDSEVIEPEGGSALRQTVTYERFPLGQLKKAVAKAADPYNTAAEISRESSITYDNSEGIFPASVTNGLGQRSRMVYHPGLGIMAYADDPNGIVSRLKYDRFGRLRQRTTDGQGALSVSYQPGQPFPDLPGHVPGLFSVVLDQVGGGHSVTTYNQLGHEVIRANRSSAGTLSYIHTKYSPIAGQVARVSRPFFFMEVSVYTEFQYDALGRATKEILPDGQEISIAHDWLNTVVIDPRHASRTVLRDELGRIMRVDEDSEAAPRPGPGWSATRPSTAISTSYTYGPFGVLNDVSVTARGASTPVKLASIHYDDLGRRTSLLDGDSGLTSTSYNGLGEPIWEVDANHQMHMYTRDKVGRIVVDTSTRDGATCLQWDSAAHGIGKLASSLSPDGITTAYGYDDKGRATQVRRHIDGKDFVVDQVLDDTGRVKALNYPAVGTERFSVALGYDAAGGVNTVSNADPLAPVSWTAALRQADGQLTEERFGNGEETTREYDKFRGWLTDISTTLPNGTGAQLLHYGHDDNGNVNKRDDKLLGTTEGFGHDWLNRLQDWTFTAGGTWSTTYEYTDLGNLKSRTTTGTGAVNLTYAYGQRDAGGHTGTAGLHAVTSVNADTYKYDPKGNQVSGPGRSVEYTSFDLPKKVTKGSVVTQFSYDAGHTRVLKKGASSTKTVYVAGLYEKRTDSSGNTTHIFHVPAAERIVAQVEWTMDGTTIKSRKATYLHDDHLGSIETVTSAQGDAKHLKYDPFGNRMDPLQATKAGTALTNVRQGFADQEHDDEIGLINMRGRVYDPKIGRFLSADPVVPMPYSSQAYNRYSYVFNNPLILIDPSGFTPKGSGATAETCKPGEVCFQDDTIHGKVPADSAPVGEQGTTTAPTSGDDGDKTAPVGPESPPPPPADPASTRPSPEMQRAYWHHIGFGTGGAEGSAGWERADTFAGEPPPPQRKTGFVDILQRIDPSKRTFANEVEDCITGSCPLYQTRTYLIGSDGSVRGPYAIAVVPTWVGGPGSAAAEGIGLAEEIGILRSAARGTGNFGLGVADATTAERLGQAWVGEGATVASDGTTLVSADGLRQFRAPSWKPNLGRVQANFERRSGTSGPWSGNGHLDILYGPEAP